MNRKAVQTGMGRPGGPRFGTYGRPPAPTQGPPDFALGAAVAGHNGEDQSVPHPRPTQSQPRDNPGQYPAPANSSGGAAASIQGGRQPEHGTGRPGGGNATGPPTVPMNRAPAGGGVQTDHTGRQPYAGREPMMARYASPTVSYTVQSPPSGGLGVDVGHDGPLPMSGNDRGAFDAHGDQTPPAAQEGVRVRDAVRALAASRGATPVNLEAPTSRGRSGGLMTSYESHQAGAGAVGVSPAGQSRGSGMQSHDGPADGSGPEQC